MDDALLSGVALKHYFGQKWLERRERERDTWKVPGSNLRIQSFPKIKPLSTPDHGWVHSWKLKQFIYYFSPKSSNSSGCCLVTKWCPTLLGPLGLQPTRLFCLRDFSCNNTGMACHFFLQGIFPIQGSNPCFLHWQEGSLPLNHQGSQGKHRGLQNKQEQTTGIFSWKHLI